jgi:hypothetical protein
VEPYFFLARIPKFNLFKQFGKRLAGNGPLSYQLEINIISTLHAILCIDCRSKKVILEKLNSIPMPLNIQNQQEHLAESFRQLDNQLSQESRLAFLKIQSWQFAVRTPEIGQSYLKEAAAMIRQSLLSFVPNTFVLSEEGYYVTMTDN